MGKKINLKASINKDKNAWKAKYSPKARGEYIVSSKRYDRGGIRLTRKY